MRGDGEKDRIVSVTATLDIDDEEGDSDVRDIASTMFCGEGFAHITG